MFSFYTLIDYLESLRLTTTLTRAIKLNPSAAVLEEVAPVFGRTFSVDFSLG